jgi:hypothetical protein
LQVDLRSEDKSEDSALPGRQIRAAGKACISGRDLNVHVSLLSYLTDNDFTVKVFNLNNIPCIKSGIV